MKALRVTLGILASLLGNLLLAGAALTLGNYLFEWSVDKVAAEWQLSLFFFGVYAAIGVLAAVLAAIWLRGVSRLISVMSTSLCLLVSWIFVSLLVYRLNAGYLWLVIGVPILLGYVLVRSLQHRGFARAV